MVARTELAAKDGTRSKLVGATLMMSNSTTMLDAGRLEGEVPELGCEPNPALAVSSMVVVLHFASSYTEYASYQAMRRQQAYYLIPFRHEHGCGTGLACSFSSKKFQDYPGRSADGGHTGGNGGCSLVVPGVSFDRPQQDLMLSLIDRTLRKVFATPQCVGEIRW